MNNNATRPTRGKAWVRSFRCGPDGQNCVELNFAQWRQVSIRGEVRVLQTSRSSTSSISAVI
jgi:hypothetical protein